LGKNKQKQTIVSREGSYMKVQFIYPNKVRHPKDISIGIAILSAVLKKHGYEVDLIDTTFDIEDGSILSRVKKFNPDLIAVSSNSANFPYAVHLATLIKSKFTIPIIIGGVHPTVAPEETITKECFDMICVGEGEVALLELVRYLKRDGKSNSIKNIWFKENNTIIRNSPRPLITDLDSLPAPDLEIYDYPRYLKSHNMVASFLTARGCPYGCTYCTNSSLKNLHKGLGPWVRYRSVGNIMAELKRTVSKFSVKKVEFYDDTFTLRPSRVKEFCEQYKREVGLPFHVNARVDCISDEMCRYLADGGCCRVQIGLESGDEQIRRKVLGRNISDETIIKACSLIKKHGMEVYTYNMIGIPYERMNNIKMTVELNRKIRPDFMSASIFTAYKGTKLYEVCRDNGWLDDQRSLGSFYSSTNLKHPHLPIKKLKRMRKWFGFRVFIAYNPMRAIMELIDRYLITFKFYSRLRTFLVTRVIQS
jgi:radical SAM superfamily enzyme YgiQ (UPF0313 family)